MTLRVILFLQVHLLLLIFITPASSEIISAARSSQYQNGDERECVLDNISKARTDAAVGAIRRACRWVYAPKPTYDLLVSASLKNYSRFDKYKTQIEFGDKPWIKHQKKEMKDLISSKKVFDVLSLPNDTKIITPFTLDDKSEDTVLRLTRDDKSVFDDINTAVEIEKAEWSKNKDLGECFLDKVDDMESIGPSNAIGTVLSICREGLTE